MTTSLMSVPFLDVRAAYRELAAEIDAAVARVLASGQYILGEEVDAFESEWAEYCGARYAVGVGNGLDALRLALLALGVEPGDEVIVPANTFIATWLAVTQVGAVPVPVEPDPRTYNLDPERMAAAIGSRTRVVIPVHLYGHPADLDPILQVAREAGIRVLEDAAQSHGAHYKGRRIGAHGDAVAWSFYPGKNLGAVGDAGAVTTNDCEVAERLRLLRNYGSKVKYVHDLQGTNSRLDPIQAAVLRVKLRYLDEWNERRRRVAAVYLDELSGAGCELPVVAPWAVPVWHLFVIRTPQRETLQRRLAEEGIGTLIHYPIPPHLQRAYAGLGFKEGDFPITERLSREILSLPMGPHVSEAQAQYVACRVREVLEEIVPRRAE